MTQIVNSLLPILLLVVLGAVLQRSGFFQADFRKGLDRLVYWVCLPALILATLAAAPDVGRAAIRMTVVLCLATAAMMVLAGGVAWLIRVPRSGIGVFAQAAFRSNLAFVGIPVISLAVDGDRATLAKAALVFAPVVILYNVLAVLGLVMAHHRIDAAMPIRLVKSLITNPLLLACAGGLVLWKLPWPMPVSIASTLDLLGKPAAPLALLSLGAAVVSYPVGKQAFAASLASLLKVAGMPLLVFVTALLIPLPREDLQVLLIFAACPTAVASFVLATQLRGDPALAAATIVLSTVFSVGSLAVILALT